MPVECFVNCAQAKRPDNTLFPDVSSFDINIDDLETYLPLVLEIFSISPEGCLYAICYICALH